MNKYNFKRHVAKFKRLHDAKVLKAIESDKQSITITASDAWYIAHLYEQHASDNNIKQKAKQAMNQYRVGNKKLVLAFTSKIKTVHGVDLVCEWLTDKGDSNE